MSFPEDFESDRGPGELARCMLEVAWATPSIPVVVVNDIGETSGISEGVQKIYTCQ
jgi:hypothetical protein